MAIKIINRGHIFCDINGNIFSRKVRAGRGIKPPHLAYKLKTGLSKPGKYPNIRLNFGPQKYTFTVHQLVFVFFNGSYNENLEINHIDGNKLNNSIFNLEAITAGQNIKKSYLTGLKSNKGEKHPLSILKNKQILEIKEKYKSGKYTLMQLGAEYGVHYTTIGKITNGNNWSHI